MVSVLEERKKFVQANEASIANLTIEFEKLDGRFASKPVFEEFMAKSEQKMSTLAGDTMKTEKFDEFLQDHNKKMIQQNMKTQLFNTKT